MSDQPQAGELVFTRVFEAPRELVFRCMTEPGHLTHFWGPAGMSTPLENIKVDLRPGPDTLHSGEHADHTRADHHDPHDGHRLPVVMGSSGGANGVISSTSNAPGASTTS